MKKALLIFILFTPYFFHSQNSKDICKTINYSIEGNKIEIKSMKIRNNEKLPLVIWLSKDNKEDYVNYFKKKGDFNILDLLNDDNFSDFTIDVYSTFLKILKPKEEFTIIYNDVKPYINQIYLNQLPSYIKESIIRTNKYDEYKFYQPNYIIIK
ncbi:hypothetical protein [Chryseobacterium balustinum]|uniref:hypothetical protein n=1 Tax=Chryseobacterium balustinum TaxID=246 RepID=UPI003CFB50D9